MLSKPFCNTPTTERYPLPQPLGSPKAESRAEEHIEDVFTNIANAAKHRGVQPHDETPRLKHEAAHADEADDPPSAVCPHQPLDAGERAVMTQQRGKARKGGDFFTAKPSQPLTCSTVCKSLRQVKTDGAAWTRRAAGITALDLEAGGLCFTPCGAPTRFRSLLSL